MATEPSPDVPVGEWLPLQQALLTLTPADHVARYQDAVARRNEYQRKLCANRIVTDFGFPRMTGGYASPIIMGSSEVERKIQNAAIDLWDALRAPLLIREFQGRGRSDVTADSWDAPFSPESWRFLEIREPDLVIHNAPTGRRIWYDLHICRSAPAADTVPATSVPAEAAAKRSSGGRPLAPEWFEAFGRLAVYMWDQSPELNDPSTRQRLVGLLAEYYPGDRKPGETQRELYLDRFLVGYRAEEDKVARKRSETNSRQ